MMDNQVNLLQSTDATSTAATLKIKKHEQIQTETRNMFCGTWYLPHSHVHNERTVLIIMAVCMAHAWNGRISTSGLKSDVTIVFLDPNFLKNAKMSVIRVHLRQI